MSKQAFWTGPLLIKNLLDNLLYLEENRLKGRKIEAGL